MLRLALIGVVALVGCRYVSHHLPATPAAETSTVGMHSADPRIDFVTVLAIDRSSFVAHVADADNPSRRFTVVLNRLPIHAHVGNVVYLSE